MSSAYATSTTRLTVPREAPPPRSFSKAVLGRARARKSCCCSTIRRHSAISSFRARRASLPAAAISNGARSPARAKIFTFTVARRTREPFRGHEPFLIALVTLDEGVNVMANMVDCRSRR